MQTRSPSSRRPWVAAFLSLLMPGLGQLYCGAFVRCLVFIIVCSGAGVAGVLALLPNVRVSGPSILVVEAVSLVMYVVGMVDAWRLARRTPPEFRLKDYNRWYAYVMLYVAVSAGHLFSILYARDHLVQPFKAGSASMYPTISTGEQVFAAKNAYVGRDPARGDIVTFYNPDDRSQVFVKRVIALAGDTIEVRDDEVYVNGSRLTRAPLSPPAVPVAAASAHRGTYFRETDGNASYSIFLSGANRKLQNLAPTVVPPHACFVLGDNRDESLDSRSFGAVPIVGIIGKVAYRYAPLRRIGPVE